MDSPSFWQRLLGWGRELKSILLAVGFVLIVRTVLAEPYHVPSPSMVPTLLTGDQLVAAKYAYGYSRYSSPIDLMPDFSGRLLGKEPERGDVVVFRLPRDPSTTYVKRLIGLPGDRIQMKDGRLYINDAIVPRRLVGPFTGDAGGRNTPTLYVETLPGGREHEIIEMSDTDRYDDTPVFVVPPRHYFMMGDNPTTPSTAASPLPTAASTSSARQPGRPRRVGAAVTRSGGRLVRRRGMVARFPAGAAPGPHPLRSGMTRAWRFTPATEAHFEPLLAIRIEVMREHLERVFRYNPSRARRIFREHFAEPGLRLILIGDDIAGCVGFRVGDAEIKIDSFYLARRYHNRGLGAAILKVLLAEADALGLPCDSMCCSAARPTASTSGTAS